MVDLWPGMEIGGEAVVAGCCGEELLLLLVGLSLIYICSFCRWQDWWRQIAVDAGGSAGA